MSDFSGAEIDDGAAARESERLKKSPTAYRTISEVAEELHIPQHRLRAWESMYPVIKPFRGESGRRYYSPQSIEIIRQISDILYVQGHRGANVMRILREQSRRGADLPDAHAPQEATAPLETSPDVFPEEGAEALSEVSHETEGHFFHSEEMQEGQEHLVPTTEILVESSYSEGGADMAHEDDLNIMPTVHENTDDGADDLRRENMWLRQELREILEELIVLRNLLPN